VNFLLIGLGRWGEKHLRVLRELGMTPWVADLRPERRTWAVGQGVERGRVVDDYRAALPHVDAVDVVTPADSHRTIVATCLGQGRHCFVEKPITVTSAEARDLAAAARESGCVLQVGHIFRFHPATVTMCEAITAGRIGEVRYATGRMSGFKRPRTDVGVTHTDAIHYFDLFAHLLGRPATSVTAVQRDYLGRGLDDMSVTVVNYGAVPAIVETNYFVPGVWRECVVVGERGSLVADYGTSTVTLHLGEHRRLAGGWEAVDTGKESLPTGGGEPLRLELEAFREACAGRRPCPVPAEDAVAALEVVEAAAQAARLGRVVTLDEVRTLPPRASR
jgi:predicted dehydrogenase